MPSVPPEPILTGGGCGVCRMCAAATGAKIASAPTVRITAASAVAPSKSARRGLRARAIMARGGGPTSPGVWLTRGNGLTCRRRDIARVTGKTSQDSDQESDRARKNRTEQMGPNHRVVPPKPSVIALAHAPWHNNKGGALPAEIRQKCDSGSYRRGRDTATQQIGRPCQVCNAYAPASMELPPEGVLHCRKLSAKSNSRKYYVKKAKSNQAPD